MRFVFRADASVKIGAGHVMRSSVIAEEAISQGIECIFVGEIADLSWLSNRINNLGYSQIISNFEHFKQNPSTDILIIDSYSIKVKNQFLNQSRWLKVVNVFDELTPNYVCDLRIHPGVSGDWITNDEFKTLSGSKYIPIRKSISGNKKIFESNPIEIVVVGGGADTNNFVSSIAKVLVNSSEEFHANLFTNNSFLELNDQRFSIVPIGLTFDKFAVKADLVFTTASTTSLEFIARGCAVGIGCSTDNQDLYYDQLGSMKIAMQVGRFIDPVWQIDVKAVMEIVKSKEDRQLLRSNSKNLIDLNGAVRIVDSIRNLLFVS